MIIIDLIDNFKVAWNEVPFNFQSHGSGEMNLICFRCNAQHFEGEVMGGSRNLFTSCCHKGKVFLEGLSDNNFFKGLYDDLISNNINKKRQAKNYFENIRKYNSCFAMISSEAQVNEEVMQGIYHFKIHDTFYHRAGPMTPACGYNPCYAQLYFYDVDTATSYRMRVETNASCNNELMRKIMEELRISNRFVRSFISMKEYCDRRVGREVCMLITVDRNRMDMRRYNDAITTDVAVIFSTVDGEPPFERNMVAYEHEQLKGIKEVELFCEARILEIVKKLQNERDQLKNQLEEIQKERAQTNIEGIIGRAKQITS